MKYLTGLLISLSLIVLSFSSAYAKSNVWLKNAAATVYDNNRINGDNIPTVAIGRSSDLGTNLDFSIILDGAVWDYGHKGTLAPGVTYEIVNKNTMDINVINGTGKEEYSLYHKNLYIPLYSIPTQGGDIKFTIDPKDEPINAITKVYAKNIDGIVRAATKPININTKGELNTITIKDESTGIIKKNAKITLSLNTGFKFKNNITPECSGKFVDKCKFFVDSNDKSKAYILITEDTSLEKGSIELNGLIIERNSDASFNVAMMNISSEKTIAPLDTNFVIAKYSKDAVYEAKETKTEANTEATTEEATEELTADLEPITTNNNNIVIAIGADSYTVGNMIYSLDTPAYISNGYTMMPLRAMANSLGISDENISYDSQSKTAVLSFSSIEVSITADESSLDINGMTLPIDCPAQITNNRLFLPLRAISNAFGIDNTNIEFNSESKTITIKR